LPDTWIDRRGLRSDEVRIDIEMLSMSIAIGTLLLESVVGASQFARVGRVSGLWTDMRGTCRLPLRGRRVDDGQRRHEDLVMHEVLRRCGVGGTE